MGRKDEPILSIVFTWELLSKVKDYMIKNEVFNRSEAIRILLIKGIEAVDERK